MPTPEFHPAARREFDHAMDYYEDCERGLGRRFRQAVNDGVVAIQQDSQSGFPSELKTRTLLVN